MKARDVIPGMVIVADDIRLVVTDCGTSLYDEETGIMTSITCFHESDGYEVSLLADPDSELEIIE